MTGVFRVLLPLRRYLPVLVALAAGLLILFVLLAAARREFAPVAERGSGSARIVEVVELLHAPAEGGQFGNVQADGFTAAFIGRHLHATAAEKHFGIRQLAVLDSVGVLAWTIVPVPAPFDHGDQDHVSVPLAGLCGFFVSAAPTARASGEPSIQFARPLRLPDQSQDSAVVVSIDSAMLATMLWRSFGAAAAGAALVRDDGTKLLRVEIVVVQPAVATPPSMVLGWLVAASGLAGLGDLRTLFSATLPVPGASLHVFVTLDASGENDQQVAGDSARRLVVALLEMHTRPAGFIASVHGRLTVVQEQIGRQRGIVDHFPTFGRTDTGTQQIGNLVTAVDGSLGMTGTAVYAGRINVEGEVIPDRRHVMLSSMPLTQAMSQILLDARDAIVKHDAARRSVRIGMGPLADQHAIELCIRDTGSGMAYEALERDFEPFFTTREVGHGTRLGVSVVDARIKSFDGFAILVNDAAGGQEGGFQLAAARMPPASQTADSYRGASDGP